MLAAARQGDQEAIAGLVQVYESKVCVVARVLLGRALRPYLDSVDLVQSVHRSLMIGLRADKFDLAAPEQLIALAITVVRRKVARKWRSVQREQRQATGEQSSASLPDLLNSLSDSRADPAHEAAFNDQVEHLCRHLDPTERRMLEMRLQGYTADEVGREIGLHKVAVRVRWTRLRRRLQESGVVVDWL
jgi:RNA polymerase sigma-70 factor (ECF subfamily)